MSQPNFLRIKISAKIALSAFVLIALSSCAKSEYNPYMGKAEQIFVAAGSPLGGASEQEWSKNPYMGSLFEGNEGANRRPAMGQRAQIGLSSAEFAAIEESLRLLEIRAFPASELAQQLSGDWTMGFDCKYATTDNANLNVIWEYPDGAKRYAIYYLGCENSLSEKLRVSYFGLVKKLRQNIGLDQWVESEERFEESVE